MGMTVLLAGLALQPAATAPEPAAEPQICRRVTFSNTRMGSRRICKTAAEWAATARDPSTDPDAEQGLDHRGHNPSTRCIGGLPPGPGEGTGSAGPRS